MAKKKEVKVVVTFVNKPSQEALDNLTDVLVEAYLKGQIKI